MDGRLFLVASAMLSCCPGTYGDNKLKTVQAFTGESAILPCVADIIDDTTTVIWSKVGLLKYVLLFHQGFETHEEKDPVFWYRSSLFMPEWRHGNISVRISDVKLSDAGNYTCMMIHKQIPKSIVIELIVGAVSEPKLSVVPSTDAGVTLQCEVQCWFPKPNITLLDDAGKEMSAHDEKTEFHPKGCFSVTRRVTLQTAINSVTCKVNEGSLNRSKVATFIMPVFRTSYTNIIIIIIAVSAVIVCGLILCTALLYMKYRDGQKLSVLHSLSACGACWSSEENKAAGDDVVDDNNSPDQHPMNNEEVIQPQIEQPNEVWLRLNPCEDSGNILLSSQAAVQGFSSQSLPADFSGVVLAVSVPSRNRNDSFVTVRAWPHQNNTEALHTDFCRHSPPKLSEETVTLLTQRTT